MKTEDIELQLLTEAIYLRYGYDFREYADASLKRRIHLVMQKHNIPTLSMLQNALLHNPDFFAQIVTEITVTTSEFFRDPLFFMALREQVFPVLATYPVFKIWHAGCSTGEEVYSLAIALKEAGLYDRAVIYATDVNSKAIKIAKDGIYSTESAKAFTANYHAAGGTGACADYFTALYGSVRFNSTLRENVLFSEHNLVTDDVFSEIHLILCRNVLIYFKRELQNRTLDVFRRSLIYKGFLALGTKETVKFLNGGDNFKLFTNPQIFQKAGPISEREVSVIT